MVSHPVVLALLGLMALGTANDLGMFHHRNIAHIRSPPLQGGWYTRLDHRIYAVNTSRDSRSVLFWFWRLGLAGHRLLVAVRARRKPMTEAWVSGGEKPRLST
jgi:hypothetical protein